MKTLCVLIGNSDNKLTQIEWSDFCYDLAALVNEYSTTVQFNGHSPGSARWQNACWVAEFDLSAAEAFAGHLQSRCALFRQDSIAVVVGETKFIKPEGAP